MKNKTVKGIVGKALVAGGLASTIGAFHDTVNNTHVIEVFNQRLQTIEEVREEYNVDVMCYGLFDRPECKYVVDEDVSDAEKQQILFDYHEALDERLDQIPIYPEDNERYVKNGLIALGGLAALGKGFHMKSSKERGG